MKSRLTPRKTPRLDKITFQDVLGGNNIEDEIYRCDIKRFFSWDLPKDKIDEIHKSLMEVKCHLSKTSIVGVRR